MRSFTTLALLAASLLVKDVLALPGHYQERDVVVVVDDVLVTEEVVVTQNTDGSLATGDASAVGTSTIPASSTVVPDASATPLIEGLGGSVVVPTTTPVTTPSVAPVVPEVVASPHTSAAPVAVETQAQAAPPTITAIAEQHQSAAAAPAAATPEAVASGAKRGLAYNNAGILGNFLSSSKISWGYNWGSSSNGLNSKYEFVPMLWGLNQNNLQNWQSDANKAIANGATHFLGFNEPDLGAQANLSPGDAAAGWKANIEPFAGKVKLVSPAVTNGGAPMGLGWLSSFIAACNGGCTMSNVAIHWYNGGDANAFKTYVSQAYAAGGNRPLWITEFQAPGDGADQAAFLNEVLPFLDSSPMVERYAYFGAFSGDGDLLDNNNGLTAVGKLFASL